MKIAKDEALNLIRILRKIEFFSGFTMSEVENILETVDKKFFKKNETIIKQGDPGRFFFIINTGKVAVFIKKPGKGTVKVGELSSGEYFGETSIIKHAPINATVKAEEDTELFVLYKYDIEMVMKKNPSAADIMKKMIERRTVMSSYELDRVDEGFFSKLKGLFGK
ncbi:MAG: cyclic nucleotide-binding domain-containing protein [Elusimicrobia bacterium]|nr:cyclic nucleotide-binding domain-containing protein [Elusimicrobiota bacterium]